MATITQTAETLNLAVTAGDDFTLTATVTQAGLDYPWAGATIASLVVNPDGSTAATPTLGNTVDGQFTWALSDTQTAALPRDTRWYYTVTKSGLTRGWLAGYVEVVARTSPAAASAATATLTIAAASTLAVTIDTAGPAAAIIATSLPTAAVAYRGQFRVLSATSVPDKLYCCLRLADGTYDWVEL